MGGTRTPFHNFPSSLQLWFLQAHEAVLSTKQLAVSQDVTTAQLSKVTRLVTTATETVNGHHTDGNLKSGDEAASLTALATQQDAHMTATGDVSQPDLSIMLETVKTLSHSLKETMAKVADTQALIDGNKELISKQAL